MNAWRLLEIGAIEEHMKSEYIDVTKPRIMRMPDIGRRHPLSMTMEKAVDILRELRHTSCRLTGNRNRLLLL